MKDKDQHVANIVVFGGVATQADLGPLLLTWFNFNG